MIDIRNPAADLAAAFVVFLVGLPLCLGIAQAVGAPPISGLVSGIVGGLVVSRLSASLLSVSGPTAGMTAITLAAMDQLGSLERFLVAVFLGGLIQIFLGLLGAGQLSAILPNSVVRGVLFSIGAILVVKQLPHAMGFGQDPLVDETLSPATTSMILDEIQRAIGSVSIGPLLVFLASLTLLLTCRGSLGHRWPRQLYAPGLLFAVLMACGFDWLAQGTRFDIANQHMVSLPEHTSLKHLLSSLPRPDFGAVFNLDVALYGVCIALLASIETLMALEGLERLDPLRRNTPKNRELIAQGIGNCLCGFLGALPLTSTIVRSAANLQAGAQGRTAAFVQGLLLLASVLFFASWLNRIPLAVLAALLILTGLRMIQNAGLSLIWARGSDQIIPFVATVCAILIDDLLVGVLIGSLFGLIFVIKSNFRSCITLTQDRNHYLVRFRKDVTFLNKFKLRTTLERIKPDSHVLIDGSRAEFLDPDILDTLTDFAERSRQSRIEVTLRNVMGYSGPLCAACLEPAPNDANCSHRVEK